MKSFAGKSGRLGIAGWLVAGCIAIGARADEVIQVRSGLANVGRVMAEAKQGGQAARMAYLGGSFTKGLGASQPGRCWRALVTSELRKAFAGKALLDFDQSIAGAGSWPAAFRTSTDVVQHYLPLALVVVELSAGDAGEPRPRVLTALEGVVRQIRVAHPQADILFVYAFSPQDLGRPAEAGSSAVIAWHEQVAEHYGIASVNLGRAVALEIAAGRLTPQEFLTAGGQPGDKAQALCAAAIRPLVARAAAEPAGKPLRHTLPKPLSASPLQQARLIPYESADFDEQGKQGWLVGQENPLDEALYRSAVGKFRHILVCQRPGPTACLRFQGDTVGLFGAAGPDSGNVEFSVDGGAWRLLACFEPGDAAGLRPMARLLAEGLDPKKEHELKLRVAAETPAGSKGRTVRIGYFLVNGSVADRYRGLTPLERIDAVYAAMAPVKYSPPGDRWRQIPKSIERLREGGVLRVVMLGDSIINDTASSQYELLLERMYPKCKVVKIRSVRGSTGCWWYKEEGRVNEWVLKHEPELLMIGGISQRDDVDSIRDVIRQVRQARPQVEVMLITPVFGTYDPAKDPQWSYTADPQGPGYRSRLMRLASEEKVEFFDMTGPWGQYLRESDKARGWFMRDPVHANERGAQILGRILEQWFRG